MPAIWFIDTNVLCELVGVPGKSDKRTAIGREANERLEAGDRFVLPVTAIIETGNHICNAKGDELPRRQAAERFVRILREAANDVSPWAIHAAVWDTEFVLQLCAGSITERPFEDLATARQLGAGDIGILVEREQFKRRSPFKDVRIWTLETELGAYA
jgi:hypothetical protein